MNALFRFVLTLVLVVVSVCCICLSSPSSFVSCYSGVNSMEATRTAVFQSRNAFCHLLPEVYSYQARYVVVVNKKTTQANSADVKTEQVASATCRVVVGGNTSSSSSSSSSSDKKAYIEYDEQHGVKNDDNISTTTGRNCNGLIINHTHHIVSIRPLFHLLLSHLLGQASSPSTTIPGGGVPTPPPSAPSGEMQPVVVPVVESDDLVSLLPLNDGGVRYFDPHTGIPLHVLWTNVTQSGSGGGGGGGDHNSSTQSDVGVEVVVHRHHLYMSNLTILRVNAERLRLRNTNDAAFDLWDRHHLRFARSYHFTVEVHTSGDDAQDNLVLRIGVVNGSVALVIDLDTGNVLANHSVARRVGGLLTIHEHLKTINHAIAVSTSMHHFSVEYHPESGYPTFYAWRNPDAVAAHDRKTRSWEISDLQEGVLPAPSRLLTPGQIAAVVLSVFMVITVALGVIYYRNNKVRRERRVLSQDAGTVDGPKNEEDDDTLELNNTGVFEDRSGNPPPAAE